MWDPGSARDPRYDGTRIHTGPSPHLQTQTEETWSLVWKRPKIVDVRPVFHLTPPEVRAKRVKQSSLQKDFEIGRWAPKLHLVGAGGIQAESAVVVPLDPPIKACERALAEEIVGTELSQVRHGSLQIGAQVSSESKFLGTVVPTRSVVEMAVSVRGRWPAIEGLGEELRRSLFPRTLPRGHVRYQRQLEELRT
jgi:hypothetical protein